MSGLFSAAFLRQIGWDADVYERSNVELVGRGAGITGHPELLEALEASGAGTEMLGIEVPKRIAIDSIALSVDVMLRWPLLKTQAAPYGALQPYIAAGAPFFITRVTPRSTAQFRNHEDDTDYSFGYKLAGGLAFHVAPNLMLFGEYRFTSVEISVDDLRASDGGHHARLRTDLDTHSALIGLSARW